jgi:midasin (ATPase involved in ribosome maturation)
MKNKGEIYIMNRNEKRQLFYTKLNELGKSQVTRSEAMAVAKECGLITAHWFFNENRLDRGLFKVPGRENVPASAQSTAQVLPMKRNEPASGHHIQSVVTELEETNLIPKKYGNYVPFGNFNDVYEIVQSNRFFPVFVTGHSGNGKTMSIEQACAKAGRKFVCVSMTPETDEGDLLGNYVLVDGNMVWRDGPVTIAARQGAVLCIDEIDYGAQNLSCLQRVLEGKPFMLKKKGELIVPAQGFTVFATANTKGKGSDDGRYMFTNVLNEAFLERFRTTMEQEFPPVAVEKKIIRKELVSAGREDNDFADRLVTWADVIRRSFADGACDEVISTRRLVHIVETYGIFGDKLKAVSLCLNRFDADTKATFIDLYTKVDASVKVTENVEVAENANVGLEIPF